MSNRLVVYCDEHSKLELTNFITNINGYSNQWIIGSVNRIQKYSKRFIIYGLSKRNLSVTDHNGLKQLVYAQLISKTQIGFTTSDIKIHHYMDNFAILLSFHEQLSEWLINQANMILRISSFNTVLHRFGHFFFYKKCTSFGHTADDCGVGVNAIICYKCGENHLQNAQWNVQIVSRRVLLFGNGGDF